jgi:hypothetical protein
LDEVLPDVIYICSDEGYEKLMAGEEWMPVGFLRKDVFHYDPSVADALSENWCCNPTF